MELKENIINFKAIIVGIISLFLFNFIGEFFEFWLTGLILPQSFDIKSTSSPLKQNLFYFIIIAVCGSFFKYFPPGCIVAIVAKKRILLHGLFIGFFAVIYLFISNFMFEITNVFDISGFFVFLNMALALFFCLTGSFCFKKILKKHK